MKAMHWGEQWMLLLVQDVATLSSFRYTATRLSKWRSSGALFNVKSAWNLCALVYTMTLAVFAVRREQ